MNSDKNKIKIVYRWLFVVCLLIFLIVIVGGTTRLTRSGLSIVEWKPVTGWLPPMSEEQWQAEFIKYQKFPEYKKINSHMNVSDFKKIFFWEYLHRLLGRLIGLAFLIPFLFFWIRGYLKKLGKMQFIIMFFLGGLQGLLGWYMVKSGLVDRPSVSHYRLASHLMLAFFVYSVILYTALKIRAGLVIEYKNNQKMIVQMELGFWSRGLGPWFILTAVIVFQIFYGALVAGLKAGLIANTFPLMNGVFIPENLFSHSSFFASIFDAPLTVQFIHRMSAWMLLFVVLFFTFFMWNRLSHSRGLLLSFLLLIIMQFVLGVATLLLHVPVLLGVLHQAGALVLLTILVLLLHKIKQNNTTFT